MFPRSFQARPVAGLRGGVSAVSLLLERGFEGEIGARPPARFVRAEDEMHGSRGEELLNFELCFTERVMFF